MPSRRPSALSTAALLGALLRVRPVSAETQVNANLTFTFGTSADDSKKISACSGLVVNRYSTTPPPAVAPTAPYYLMVFPQAGSPQVVPGGNGNFNWTCNYSSGSQLVLGMVDSAGNTGGISETVYGVSTSSTTCTTSPPTTLGALTTSPSSGQVPQCSDVELSWSGGTPPYTLTVAHIAALPFNITGIAGSPWNWTNTLQAGGQGILALSDSTGKWFTATEIFQSGASSESACLAGTVPSSGSSGSGSGSGSGDSGSGSSSGSSSSSSGSSSSDGKYIGAGVGAGVAVLGLAALGLFMFFRNKRKDGGRMSGSYGPEKPGGSYTSDRPLRPDSEEHQHLNLPNASQYGGGPSPSAASDDYRNGGSDSAYMHGPHSAGWSPGPGASYPAASSYGAPSPRSAAFPQSNRVSMASSSGSHHGGPAQYPPMPAPPVPSTGFRIANPDADAGPSAGPSRGGNRRASLGPGSAYNQDYEGKNGQRVPDLPGASKYFQARDVADQAEPNFEDELPPAYLDRRRGEK